jgi:pimeloyl-ACP methyl ester carboxylesterase
MMRRYTGIALCIVSLLLAGCGHYSQRVLANTVSKDGVTLSFSVYGQGDVTLVFIHGWGGDGRYWCNQVPYFASKYRVVTMDLAGHGNSGSQRENYTVEAFGQDVVAVLEAVDAKKAILVGHSMSGTIALQAAVLAQDRVIGIVGVDTLQDMGEVWGEKGKQFYDLLAADFKTNTTKAIGDMFPKNADPVLLETVARDISSAPRDIALSTMKNYVQAKDSDYVSKLHIPIKCVNADLWPNNVERNKQLNPWFEMELMKGYGHFIMLEAPDQFNPLLERMIQSILKENSAKK